MAKATTDQKIALREELISKLREQMVTRKERIDAMEVRINDMKTARENMIVGLHDMQEEIDACTLQIAELRGK